MPKVQSIRTADAPDGDVCANWAYRTWMRKEQNYKCTMLRDESVHISASEAQSSGLGCSGGTIQHYRCALFDESLAYELGIGPKKCVSCKTGGGNE